MIERSCGFESRYSHHIFNAPMVKLVDASDLKSAGRKAVPVRPRLGAPILKREAMFKLIKTWLQNKKAKKKQRLAQERNQMLLRGLLDSCKKNRPELIRQYLAAGANPDAHTVDPKSKLPNSSALIIAASMGNVEMVDMLLKAGANPNLKIINDLKASSNSQDLSALDFCFAYLFPGASTLGKLVSILGSITIQNQDYIACARLLILAGAKFSMDSILVQELFKHVHGIEQQLKDWTKQYNSTLCEKNLNHATAQAKCSRKPVRI